MYGTNGGNRSDGADETLELQGAQRRMERRVVEQGGYEVCRSSGSKFHALADG
jgi:hypothetical protein